MAKTTRQLRLENKIPFQIVAWYGDPEKIDHSNWEAEALVADQYGTYNATITAKDGKLYLMGDAAWQVKEIPIDENEADPGLQ